MLQRDVERLNVLSGQRRAHRLDRAADHDRHFPAEFLERPADAHAGRLDVQRILTRFDEQRVDAALDEGERLFAVRFGQFVKR